MSQDRRWACRSRLRSRETDFHCKKQRLRRGLETGFGRAERIRRVRRETRRIRIRASEKGLDRLALWFRRSNAGSEWRQSAGRSDAALGGLLRADYASLEDARL